jgi:tryptophanyl-tRNA synthetase
MRKRVLSGIQPTGKIHLGNYFGAVRNWVALQEEYDCFYSIVNYHAMTMPFKPQNLLESSWDLAFSLLALGVEPKSLFIQSLVPEHTELAWIFNCFCGYGELGRMTQFKDKSEQVKETNSEAFISTGLFTYPILQAADILLYKADFVPVGKDQEQHLELSRTIAHRFNTQIGGKPYFVMPETLFSETPKIVSPADPNKKMSKSLGEKHYIDVFGEEAQVRKQIKSAVTDTGEQVLDANGNIVMSAGVENLFTLLKACGDTENHAALMADYEANTLKYGHLKEKVADAVVLLTNDFRTKKIALEADKKAIKTELLDASVDIRKVAQTTIREVKGLVGLPNTK